MKLKLVRILLLTGAPLVAFVICFYNISLIPHFDIGFNETFIALTCILVTLIVTVLALVALYKLTRPGKNNPWACLFVVALYWLFIWGFCYGKCVLEATRDLQMMLYGDI